MVDHKDISKNAFRFQVSGFRVLSRCLASSLITSEHPSSRYGKETFPSSPILRVYQGFLVVLFLSDLNSSYCLFFASCRETHLGAEGKDSFSISALGFM
mgnify:CR=1 FL=1